MWIVLIALALWPALKLLRALHAAWQAIPASNADFDFA